MLLLDDLDDLRFDNRFTRALPADPQRLNLTRPVYGAAYSWVAPEAVRAPALVAHSREVAELLGLSEAAIRSPRFLEVFSGNAQLAGMAPFAMAYGGHQFGHWAGQLGDGRAINLGEALGAGGEPWFLQLKGAGPTPYSRTADGRAVLRSSVREFLCSEAMFHLGVPTTRALSLVTTGEDVVRDMFYDGHPKAEPGAVVCRVARSFTRFGNFELFASRGEHELLKQLADHTIQSHFPSLLAPGADPTASTYADWFGEVAARTSEMVVHWARVGFVHGVMNTDNMSILGQTIDYGPYGWLEDYDPSWTPNTTDAGQGRYAFGQQSKIALWNLSKLARALHPLVGEAAPLQAVLEDYAGAYTGRWRAMMAAKLGLDELVGEDGLLLAQELLQLLSVVETDMTLFFRGLAEVLDAGSERALPGCLEAAFYQPDEVPSGHRAQLSAWLGRYLGRVREAGQTSDERLPRMHAVNPKYVLRNYLAQLAIDAAEAGDPSLVHELLDTLRRPYDEQPERAHLAAKRPDWARDRPGCSQLSCSS